MTGSMVVEGQVEKVNVSEVDSIGGAKPEPEERPLTVTMAIEKGTGHEESVGDGAALLTLDRAKMVSVEMTVEERAKLLGKYCGNCIHFKHALGQVSLERMAYRGTDKDKDHLRSLFAELTEQTPPEDITDEHVPMEEVFAPTYAERAMARMGLCVAITAAVNEDTLVFPECHCPASEIPEVMKDLWVAKDTTVERQVREARDALFGAAAGGVP